MLVDPLGAKYPTAALLQRFYDSIEQEVRSVPGVGSIAWTSGVPFGDSVFGDIYFDIVGQAQGEESRRTPAQYQTVSPSYFQTVDLPIINGRGFANSDTAESLPVCIVNEAFVRGHLQGRNPIGMRVALRGSESSKEPPTVREIVGVARQVKGRPDEIQDLVQIYAPMVQDPVDDIYLAVRPASGRADALTGGVRAAIARIDKEQLVSVREIATLEDVAWTATGRQRFRAVLLMTFAALSLVLAMVGVFGILAYSVQQRVRDFGVRRALGATTGDVVRLVARSAVRVIAAGAVIGLALAVALGRFIATMLYGVKPLDPITFASVTTLIALTGVLAIAGPAWRAVRIDPARALRND
jgi:putative ABC transport system permease protein